MVRFPRSGVDKNTLNFLLKHILLEYSCIAVPEEELDRLVHEALGIEHDSVFFVEWENEKLFVLRVVVELVYLIFRVESGYDVIIKSLILRLWLHHNNHLRFGQRDNFSETLEILLFFFIILVTFRKSLSCWQNAVIVTFGYSQIFVFFKDIEDFDLLFGFGVKSDGMFIKVLEFESVISFNVIRSLMDEILIVNVPELPMSSIEIQPSMILWENNNLLK